jgi:molecular chaperone DnaK
MEETRKALEKDDAVEINAALEGLKKKLYEAGTELYKRAGAQASAPPPPEEPSSGPSEEPTSGGEEPKGDEKVVDADYEVVDEDKEKEKDKESGNAESATGRARMLLRKK